jgi:hypothetical protein
VAQLVTVRTIRAAYELLRAFHPFARWKLPPASEVRIELVSNLKTDGEYNFDGKRHTIGVNPTTHYTLLDLVETVAHEMAHMRQELTGKRPATKDDQHNPEFHRLARLICRDLGFNGKRF